MYLLTTKFIVMCFDVRVTDKVAKIADTDIHCFKVLALEGKKLMSPSIIAKRTLWKAGVAHRVPNMRRINIGSINEGLHSMKTQGACKAWIEYRDDRKIYPAIIPMGSIYWENKDQYCSDTLKITSKEPVPLHQERVPLRNKRVVAKRKPAKRK